MAKWGAQGTEEGLALTALGGERSLIREIGVVMGGVRGGLVCNTGGRRGRMSRGKSRIE